ncbi:hypothetical protein Tco_0876556 [Tanacetum coccineum]|uniref:Transposase n=1 Tax=Tanacetum coccineum TaxID=301880 RepID=A0ABQ5BSK5_9ASTR
MTRTFRRVYVCLGALKQGFRDCGREILGLDGCFMPVEAESKASWCWFLNLLGEDLGIEVNFNYTFISDRQKFPSTEHRHCVRHIHENMKSQLKGGVYKEMLWNAAKAASVGEFNKKMAELKQSQIEYLMKRIVVIQKVIAKTVIPLTPSVIKLFDAIKKATEYIVQWNGAAIYNMSKNSVGVAIPEQWVHAAYRLETWAHVYSFKVNPCNGREMWPVVEATTVIVPPLYKPQVGRPPKKRKKSHDEIANENCPSGKLSRKGKSVRCGKYGNVGHNRKGCRGQGGATQAGGSSARNVSGQGGVRRTVGARNVSGQASARQAAGARTVYGQAGGTNNVSSQSGGSS